jgi:hypothetical protein
MPRSGRLSLIPIASGVVAAAVTAVIILALSGVGISRAETPVLAPGVQSLAVDGKSVGAPTAVLDVASGAPTISGRILPGKSTVVLSIDGTIEWEATVDPTTGEFSTVVPEAVGAGTHTLAIDDVTVATFSVVAELPASGAGGGSGGNGFGVQPWVFVLASLGLGLGAGLFLIARREVWR